MSEMTLNDYLDPDALRTECANKIEALQKINEEIPVTEKAMDDFINEDGLSGLAYLNMKEHIADYKSALEGFKYANELDISDLKALSDNLGDEKLNGFLILSSIASCKALIFRYNNQINTWNNIISFMEGFDILDIRVELENLVAYATRARDNTQAYLDMQVSKKEFFENLEDTTNTYFKVSAKYRDILNPALKNIYDCFDETSITYNEILNVSWRNSLDELSDNGKMYELRQELEDAGLTDKNVDEMSDEERASYLGKVAEIVQKYFPDLNVGDEIEIPLGMGCTFYYGIEGETSISETGVTVNAILEDEALALSGIKITGEDGDYSLETGYDKDDGGLVGFSDEVNTVETTVDGITISSQIDDHYSVELSLSDSVEEIKAEASVIASEDYGSIKTTVGIKQQKTNGGYIKTPEPSEITFPTWRAPEPDKEAIKEIALALGVSVATVSLIADILSEVCCGVCIFALVFG